MPREKGKLEKDLDRIKKRLQASKKTLHDSEIKAEDLDATIQKAIREQEKRKKN